MSLPAGVTVVLVRPKFQGNTGSVARAMANFSLDRLVIVGDTPLDDDAFRFSKHARPILENAGRAATLDEVLADADLSVATSGIINVSDKKRERNPLSPKELAERLNDYQGAVALVFGPEDDGLSREEITACDLVVTVPTDPGYPVMNLSHSAATLFYELYCAGGRVAKRTRKATSDEKELLFLKFRSLLEVTDYPEHKTDKTMTLFRRTMGRAVPSKWEFHTLMGVFDRAINRIDPNAGDVSIGDVPDDEGPGDAGDGNGGGKE